MKFYPHHIGDFNNATRHLTRVERMLYREATELYYVQESPLISDIKKLERLLLVQTDEEKTALKTILDEFFILTEAGYYNERCDYEISKYRANSSAKARAGIASATKRQQKLTGVEQVFNRCGTDVQQTNNQLTNNNIHTNRPTDNNNIKNNSKPKNQTKVNKEFLPTDESVLWAQKKYPRLDLKIETEKFLNYFLAKGTRYSDWQLCWRNWIDRAETKPAGQQTIHEKRAQVAEEMYGDLARELYGADAMGGKQNGRTTERGSGAVPNEITVEDVGKPSGSDGQGISQDGGDVRKTLERPVGERPDDGGEGGVDDSDLQL